MRRRPLARVDDHCDAGLFGRLPSGSAGREIIGGTVGREERTVRVSDSRGHSTDRLPDDSRSGGPEPFALDCRNQQVEVHGRISRVLAYWRFG